MLKPRPSPTKESTSDCLSAPPPVGPLTQTMNCRICGSTQIRELGELEYYVGFSWMIHECSRCRCRFTKHDDAIYQWLHTHAGSSYGLYNELAEEFKGLFDDQDVSVLKRELCRTSKFRFVIDAAQSLPKRAKVLEIGCSRGYLVSYFIRCGYDILGTDVSPEAVGSAKAAFGNFFDASDSPAVEPRAPYDLIYHVGTIGCVKDPLGLTRQLLDMLKPGGRLLFNAPNADSCWLNEHLWIDAAPPPDLVTLFRPGFWREQFSSVADVVEAVETCSPEQAFRIHLQKLVGRKWQKPVPIPIEESLNDFKGIRTNSGSAQERLWDYIEKGAVKLGRLTGTLNVALSQPSPFGLLVAMTKR